ncbi:hypothetical protein Hanom_Chr07g00598091 [Helianthus anomalus]
MILPNNKRGRFAKTISFVVKHSSAAEGQEIKSTWRNPKRRRRTGPYLADILARVLWSGSFKK